MPTQHNQFSIVGVGLFALFIAGILAAMLAWANPAHAQQEGARPRLIISPTELHVGEGDSVSYTVHFDKNPAWFESVNCGNNLEPVYVNMRGVDSAELDVAPYTPAFRTGNANCEGGNWDSPRAVTVTPVDDGVESPQRTFTISHAVWDADGGTPVEDTETPKVRVTVYDNDPPGYWVSISDGSGAIEGSNVTFTLTRYSEDMTQPLTVNVSLSETGSMLSGSRSRSAEFAANVATSTLMVETADDDLDENNSEIKATIRAPSGYVISGRPWDTATARDNDFAVYGLSVDPDTIAEGERSTVKVYITNGVTIGDNQTFTLDFTGSTAAADYRVSAETLTLRARQSEVTVTVTAVDDPDYEPAEVVRVLARHGTRTIGSKTITIEASDLDAPQPAWSGTLTVGVNSNNNGYDSSPSFGSLTPATFMVDGTTYTVDHLYLNTTDSTLLFGTNSNLSTDFVLELDGQEFRPSGASGTLRAYEWVAPSLNWSNGQTVAVKLDVFDPMLSGVTMSEVTEVAPFTATANVATVNANGSVIYLRYRSAGSSSWSNPNPSMITVMPGMTSVTFSLTSLTDTTVYEVQASLESTFAEFADAPASEKTAFTAGTPPSPPPVPGGGGGGGGTSPVVEDSCVTDLGPLTATATQTGTWADDCDSANRSGSYARFYTFTLAQETEVTIDLTSDEDTYLYVLQGTGSGGTVEEENDDIVSGSTNSQVVATLAAGAYTIEATTNTAGATGSFTLTITVGDLPTANVSRAAGSEDALVRPGSPVSLTATFSRPVSGFTIDDITVENGTVSNFAGNGAVYTFDVTPDGIGDVTVEIPAGAAEYANGNGNPAALRFSLGITYDDNGDSGISRGEAIAAIRDYFSDRITRAQAIAVIRLYFSAPTGPGPEPGPQPGPSSIESDRAALVVLYNTAGGANWADSSGWLSDLPLGEWFGIETDDNGRVVRVDLQENSLSGAIPGDLGNLTSLKWLFLNNHTISCQESPCRATSPTANRLTGSIPPELGQLTNLESLYLGANLLTGEIPSELAGLVRLRHLSLFVSQLSGEIPSWLGDLANLVRLNLASNDFAGPIPVELGNLTNLYHLELSVNQLTGTIPASLGNLTGLNHLALNSNQLTGSIPASLGNLSNLNSMYISENELSGCIPAGLRRVPGNDFFELPFCSQ